MSDATATVAPSGAVRTPEHPIHLAISGTYSTGKSTTTEALSVATGIPRTHALTSREILKDLVPGKQVQELSAVELLALGLRRLEERIHNEAMPGSFVSDGSVIHEWIYGEARMRVGVNPGDGALHKLLTELAGLPVKRFYRQYMQAYGQITKARAKRTYDAYVHLPVEFPMKADGHRPVSERFRRMSDELLIHTLEEMEMPYHVVRGSVEERVDQIIRIFDLPTVLPVGEAVTIAQRRVREASELLEADSRSHAAQREKSRLRRIRYALRY
ncbi:ATP-binding protein [Streptomyces sp. LX-29]|uniref:ATP/GTP-binding protein n=1 Tax=Streptomyces sp. LX-29 TaxID=2900152 RepID=UPI00240DB304|nr:ATP-binding protein [Streptomyces sp. LX-29]WFB09903.1 ATP-binding protein [Streptomyces sp. LX-29]